MGWHDISKWSTRLWYTSVTWVDCVLKRDGTSAGTRFHLSLKRKNPFKLARVSDQTITGSRGVRISGSNAGYTTFWGSVKSTGYPLHSPVSPSLPPPPMHYCVPSHFNWTLHTWNHKSTSLPGEHRIKFSIVLLTLSEPTSNLIWQYDFRILLRCRKMSDTVFVAFVRPLLEPVWRFSSCSTDFSQQIAQVVLFLFLHVLLF
jgi:hypothetical protein